MLKVQISLRAVLILVAVIAAILAYVVVPITRVRREARIASQLEAIGASVVYGPPYIGPIPVERIPDRLSSIVGESVFANVVDVTIYGPIDSGANLGVLPQLTSLEHLDLTGVHLSDRQAAEIAKCRNIRRLCVFNTSMSDVGVKLLASLPLIELHLTGEQVTDDWLLAASNISTLESLSLFSCQQLTGREFARLAALPQLKDLEIDNCYEVDDEAIGQLNGMTALERLLLRNVSISDRSCEAIASMSKLRSLGLVNCDITDDGASKLVSLFELEALDLSGTMVGDTGVAALSTLRNLQSLAIIKTACTESVVENLRALRSLKHLDIGPNVSQEGAKVLKMSLATCEIRLFDRQGKRVLTLE